MYQAFNIFFTGMPICWYCAFDFQYSKERLLSEPAFYKIGLKNKCFNKFVFWEWYLYALWQSAVILFLSMYTFEESTGKLKNVINKSDEVISGSLMFNGTFIIQAIVLLVNGKIFLATHFHTAWSLFWQIGSVAWFYVFFIFENYYTKNKFELFGMFPLQMSFLSTYVLLLLFLVGFSLVDQVQSHLDQYYLEKVEMQEFEKDRSQ
jgi:magnesium-transporting ATPase (P-type)